MKKKVLLMVLAAAVLVVASVGGTLAWMTASQSVTNTFTVGKVDIGLTEPHFPTTTPKLVPGAVIPKDPTVEVKAGSESAFIFVKAVVNAKVAAVTEALTPGTGWILHSKTTETNGDVTYVFAYASADTVAGLTSVALGTTSAAFSGVTVKTTATDADLAFITGSNNTIVVDAYAIQAANVSSSLSTVDAIYAAAQAA